MSDRRAEITKLAAGFEHDTDHSTQVARLAEEMFDACASLHRLSLAEKELLVYAALLHDIGWCEGQHQHHKRAYELILANHPEWLSPRETAVVANVARYHRKALPKPSHEGFGSLLPEDQEIVRKLGGLIRIADGLDVTHSARVSIVSCDSDSETARINLACDADCTLEIETAQEKADLFREVYNRKVSFQTIDN